MVSDEPKYYEDIQITVDGWPWNVRESDFRRRDGIERRAQVPQKRGISHERRLAALVAAVSGNRRVARADRRSGTDRRRT
jgi:hypothetical protein